MFFLKLQNFFFRHLKCKCSNVVRHYLGGQTGMIASLRSSLKATPPLPQNYEHILVWFDFRTFSNSAPELWNALLVLLQTMVWFGFRTFSNSAPELWNALLLQTMVWFGFRTFFQLCSRTLESPATTNNQGGRFFGSIPQTSENPPVLLMTLPHWVFFSCSLF